jgi:hypothetical protein
MALSLNAAKAERHRLEQALYALENRAALLRDAEAASLAKAAAMRAKAESATAAHQARAIRSHSPLGQPSTMRDRGPRKPPSPSAPAGCHRQPAKDGTAHRTRSGLPAAANTFPSAS